MSAFSLTSSNPMMPGGIALDQGLLYLIQDICSLICLKFDRPFSDAQISKAATSLGISLGFLISRERRRATTPLITKDLSFVTARTRNPKEEVFDDKRRCVSKGEKDWYCLQLWEFANSPHPNASPQILAVGDLTKSPAEVLDAFIVMTERCNREWATQDQGKAAEDKLKAARNQQKIARNRKKIEEKGEEQLDEKKVKERAAALEELEKLYANSPGKKYGGTVKPRTTPKKKKVLSEETIVDDEE